MGEVPRLSAPAPTVEPIGVARLADTRSGVDRITASTTTLLVPALTVKLPESERPIVPTGLPSTDSIPGNLQRSSRDRPVKLGKRDTGPADVAGIGPLQKTDPKDLRRESERCFAGGDVERRQRNQVPEVVDCLPRSGHVRRASLRTDAVERGVVGIEPPQREGGADETHPLAHRQVPVPSQGTGQVKRRR